MSSKAKKRRTIEPNATPATQLEAEEIQIRDSVRHQKVRIRAYELYRERGEQPGRDLDDWLQAERELSLGKRS